MFFQFYFYIIIVLSGLFPVSSYDYHYKYRTRYLKDLKIPEEMKLFIQLSQSTLCGGNVLFEKGGGELEVNISVKIRLS